MNETDLKKRDLLKALPAAPALLLGGAAGLTATPAQGYPMFEFKFVYASCGDGRVLDIAVSTCKAELDADLAGSDKPVEVAVLRILELIGFEDDDGNRSRVQGLLRGIGLPDGPGSLVEIAEIKTSNGNIPVVRTNTHVAVFVA